MSDADVITDIEMKWEQNCKNRSTEVKCMGIDVTCEHNHVHSGKRTRHCRGSIPLMELQLMEQLEHFSHDHPLNLVHMQLNHNNESSGEEEEERDENEENFVAKNHHYGECEMCQEQIYSFHLCYYHCKDCDYSLHNFCAEMPLILKNHPSHPNHDLTLGRRYHGYYVEYGWMCVVCNIKRKDFFYYRCPICEFRMDIICATIYEQKMDHAGHPHQLTRHSKELVSRCNACGEKHEGTFYHCTTCSLYSIHLDCALMPSKLLIQQPTNDTFFHSHPLTLSYSFPLIEQETKFFPRCRVCDGIFEIYFWLYKCDRCRYYAHLNCATSKMEPFMSILRHPGRGKTYKNFKDEDHPNLLHCPFPDESYSLIKHHFFSQKDLVVQESHAETLNHFGHKHPLILLDTQTSVSNNSVALHNPMKRTQLLCDGCVNPITEVPFYKCSQDDLQCGFFLHEWCAKLPSEVHDHPGHPEHTLVLLPNINPRKFGLFHCFICMLLSNRFMYECTRCMYYVCINCAFLPTEIIHEAHPDHLLLRIKAPASLFIKKGCNGCRDDLDDRIVFHCPACDFYLHTKCAFFLPKMIRHNQDKHPLSLTYNPVENHPGEYFCEICEDEFDPGKWFYHCTLCAQSMHSACAPVIIDCVQTVSPEYDIPVFRYIHVKFGGTFEIQGHQHRLAFVQGIKGHGLCKKCHYSLQHRMILKCLECDYACHLYCATLKLATDQVP